MRTYVPLTADHPIIRDGEVCPGCKKPFQVGDIVTLIVIGPGDNEKKRELVRAGQSYAAVAIPAHAECADPN